MCRFSDFIHSVALFLKKKCFIFLPLYYVSERKFLSSLKTLPLLFSIFYIIFFFLLGGSALLKGVEFFRSISCFFFFYYLFGGISLRHHGDREVKGNVTFLSVLCNELTLLLETCSSCPILLHSTLPYN